jgi:hypothetical protein
MTPAAVHRIAEHGDASQRFYTFAGTMVLAGLAALAVALSSEVYVVFLKVTASQQWSILVATCAMLCLFAFWYALPLLLRRPR